MATAMTKVTKTLTAFNTVSTSPNSHEALLLLNLLIFDDLRRRPPGVRIPLLLLLAHYTPPSP